MKEIIELIILVPPITIAVVAIIIAISVNVRKALERRK